MAHYQHNNTIHTIKGPQILSLKYFLVSLDLLQPSALAAIIASQGT